MKGLYFYKLNSPYSEDVTKNCKLTINEIDSNFLSLKDEDIASAEFDKKSKSLVLTRNNGEQLIVDLSDVTYDLNVETSCSADEGASITISYDGADGNQTVTFDHIVTVDNLRSVIGSDLLTKVITDGTLKGDGTISSPLGLSGTEKSGMIAPVKGRLDLTKGGKLPEVAKLGTRYITIEYVNDYGYLYNGEALAKITESLEKEGKGWRVPTKADFDVLLNSIEPCDYQNHNSAKCHIDLGLVAGKYLKTECGWLGEPDCECTSTAPMTGCSVQDQVSSEDTDYVEGEQNIEITDEPNLNPESYQGVDKYGMGILPSGNAILDAFNRPQANYFKEKSFFWTSTHVHGDIDQDVYVKVFDWNKTTVSQAAECPSPYYSVRLVKDYDGSNYFDSEYIDGVLYKTILFPKSRQVWLATNYAKNEGFETSGVPMITDVNNGEVLEKRKALFVNEWNGEYWEKRALNEGETVVVENPCFDSEGDQVRTVCWLDQEGVKHCVDVTISKETQSNIEYRVYTTDGCNKELVNTDDIVVERIVNIMTPMIEDERNERVKGDEQLWSALEQEAAARTEVDDQQWDAINQEAEARRAVDEQLWDAIGKEASARAEVDNQQWDAIKAESDARTEVDNQQWDAINKEAEARTEVDNQQWEAINQEIGRATAAEEALDAKINAEIERATKAEKALEDAILEEGAKREEEDAKLNDKIDAEIERAKAAEKALHDADQNTSKDYVLSVKADGEYNLVIDSNDGDNAKAIRIKIDGNYGEI